MEQLGREIDALEGEVKTLKRQIASAQARLDKALTARDNLDERGTKAAKAKAEKEVNDATDVLKGYQKQLATTEEKLKKLDDRRDGMCAADHSFVFAHSANSTLYFCDSVASCC